MEGEDDRRDDIPESPPPMRASSSSAAKKSSASSLVGAMRGCLNPFLFVVTMSNLRQTKRARKILRHADPNRKQRKNRARVRFRLPKSKTVRVIQPFESDSVFIRRWRHFMAGPLCYEVWAFPFRLAFGESGMHSVVIADMCCDSFFILSACFKCMTVIQPYTLPDQDEAIRSFQGIFGVYLRRNFLVEFTPLILYYIITFTLTGGDSLSQALWWLATVPRVLTRGRQIATYFRDMSNDLQVSARLLESVKFALIIILSSHWVGCLFFWLSRIMSHDHTTWVHEFQLLLPLFDKQESPVSVKYILCLYKGFNAFSNLGYDYGMPLNPVELCYSLLVMAAQVYLSALILGTLLNYLVRNNPAEEQHKQLLAALAGHVEEKNIPPELRDRMLRHFNFQHKKNLGRNAEMLWFLPKGLTVKVAYHKYQSTMDKCALEGNAFSGCEQAFLDDCLSRLKVMHFTPGELLIKKGELPRELYMVVEGALVMMDEDNRVLTVIRADVPDMPPYANAAPFMIGVPNPHPLIASLDGECTTLVLTKEDADALFQLYPAERERIVENLLATYGLQPNGKDLVLSEEKRAETNGVEGWVEMREQVREALKSQRLQTLADFQQAVETADIDKILQLIAMGVDANLRNYDGRTALHIACFKGHSKVVETLLDNSADPNITDRWGRTAQLEAVYYRQKACVGLLEQRSAVVPQTYLTEKLRHDAIKGRVEKVRQILEVGGFEVNASDYDGRTALHMACAHGHEEIVDQLLRAKANINATDRFGGTPLKDCVVSGHSMLATILRTRGGVLPEGMGAELICTAAGEGDIQTLNLLFESHENMNTGDYDARCALHLAAAEARILAVSFLLTHTANPNSEDRWGGRPMDDALRGGTLYHMYCAKLIQSWGGKPGTLADDEEKLARLEAVSIKDALNLVQRLTALGFDKRRIERVGEQELLTSFESCMRVIPIVDTIRGHADVLAECVDETSECVIDIFDDIIGVLHSMSERLNPNAGVVQVGSVRDLKKMTRVNLWDKVRLAKDSKLLYAAMDPSHPLHASRHHSNPRVPRRKSVRRLSREESGSPLAGVLREGESQLSEAITMEPDVDTRRSQNTRSKGHITHRDESMSLAKRASQLRLEMATVRDAIDEEHGADEFAFYAAVNGIESDEEEQLHEEIDRIEAQAEMLDKLGMTSHKHAATAFLKAATNLMTISESFALLRSLFLNPRFGGTGNPGGGAPGNFTKVNSDSKAPAGLDRKEEENADDQLVTQFDIIRVLDVLQIDVSNDDIDVIVEEAETYSLTHAPHLLARTHASHTHGQGHRGSGGADPHLAAADKLLAYVDKGTSHANSSDKKEDSPNKALQNAETAVPLAAVLAGSKSFRLLVCDMPIDHELCTLLESRLKEVLSEDQMQELQVLDQRIVKEGDLIHPALDNDGRVFFVVRHGFFVASHPDAGNQTGVPLGGADKKHEKKPKKKAAQPMSIRQGDVFGALRALDPTPGLIEREVSAASEGLLLVVTCASLKQVIGKDVALNIRVQKLMAECPSANAQEEAKQAPRGLLRGASLRKMGEGIKEAFKSARRPSESWGGGGMQSTRLGRVPSHQSSEDSLSEVRRPMVKRLSSGGKKPEPRSTPGEVQRRGLCETMAVLEDLWNSLTAGHTFVPRPLLEVICQSLGEASSHAFQQVFFSPTRELEHLLVEDEFWRCWLAFTAEQGLEDADEDEDDLQERLRRRDEDGDSDTGEEEVALEEAIQERVSLFDRFMGRFSPARSLRKRFFEASAIDQYEPAYLQITGDLKVPLPIDKVPELLSNIFVDFPFRISKHNTREFIATFAGSESKPDGVYWADIRHVLKKRRMTVQEQEYQIVLGSALDPRSKYHENWRWLIYVVALFYLATVPVRAAFLPWDSMLHVIPLATDLPADVLTTIHFAVALNTGYRNRRSAWITSRLRIAKKLPLSLWVSAIPLDWMAWLAGAGNEVACFCRIPRMALMLAIRHSVVQSRNKGVRSQVERMMRMVLMTVHFCACIWFFLGRSYYRWVEPNWAVSWYRVDPSIAHLTFERDAYGWKASSTVWDQYLFSVHWVTATLTVNGLVGPVVPQNGVELVFCILLMVLNMTLFRWIIGEISSIIMNADVQNVKRREEYSQYKSFIDSNKLPDELGDEIMAHFHNTNRAMVAQEKILAGLCASVLVDRARFLYREIVGNIEVFQGCTDAFLDALCVVVSEVHFNPEETVFESNTTATDLCMIVAGYIETFQVMAKGEVKMGEHEEGAAPGVLGFFFDTKHLHTGRAGKAGTTCLRLNRSQFVSLVLLFRSDEAVIGRNVLTQLKKQTKAATMGYAQSVTFSVNSRGQRSNAASSRQATSRDGRSQQGSQSQSRKNQGMSEGSLQSKLTHEAREDMGGGDGDESNKSSVDAETKENDRKMAVSASRKLKALLVQRKGRFLHMLHSASFEGDAAKVEEILQGSADISINDTDVQGRTALHIAASEGHVDVVQYLIQSGADVSIKDKNGNTALNDAVRHEQDEVAKVLRAKFPWLKLKLTDADAADILCKLAVRVDSTAELRRLLENGINVNAVNFDERSALMLAACEGHAHIVDLLMENKADPELTDKWGKTAMAGAIAEDRREVQEVLRKWGVKHGKGEMELTVAMCDIAAVNDVKTLRVMVKNGVDPSLGDYDMRTPLHLAASNQCLTVLEFLLDFEPKMNVNPIDRFGGTPLEDAYRHSNTAAIELLEARGGLRKDDPSQSKAMADQLEEIQKLQRKHREPKVQQTMAESLEGQAAQALSEFLVPTIIKDTSKLIASLTTVLEGLKGLMRAGQLQKSGPLAAPNKAAWRNWNQLLPDEKAREKMPGSPRLAEALTRGISKLPARTLEEEADGKMATVRPDEDFSPEDRRRASSREEDRGIRSRSDSLEVSEKKTLPVMAIGASFGAAEDELQQVGADAGAGPGNAAEITGNEVVEITSNDGIETRGNAVEAVTKLASGGEQDEEEDEGEEADQLPGMINSPRAPPNGGLLSQNRHLAKRDLPAASTRRRSVRSLPKGDEVHFASLEDGLETMMETLREMKLVIINVRRSIEVQSDNQADEGPETSSPEVNLAWMSDSKSWLLVSRQFRANAAVLKRQLSICMLMYKLARRSIKEVKRLLQRSRVHESQQRARGKRRSFSN